MTWQVLLVKLPDALSSIADLPEDYAPPSLGDPETVTERIVHAVRGARSSSTGVSCEAADDVVVLRAEDFVIEAQLGGVLEVDRVVLSVFGSDAAWSLVGDVARELGTAAIDCETDELLDPDSAPPDTLRAWQARIDALR